MKCTKQGCEGRVLVSNRTQIEIEDAYFPNVIPCDMCGRLHCLQGNEVAKCPVVVMLDNNKVPYIIDGKVEYR